MAPPGCQSAASATRARLRDKAIGQAMDGMLDTDDNLQRRGAELAITPDPDSVG